MTIFEAASETLVKIVNNRKFSDSAVYTCKSSVFDFETWEILSSVPYARLKDNMALDVARLMKIFQKAYHASRAIFFKLHKIRKSSKISFSLNKKMHIYLPNPTINIRLGS